MRYVSQNNNEYGAVEVKMECREFMCRTNIFSNKLRILNEFLNYFDIHIDVDVYDDDDSDDEDLK